MTVANLYRRIVLALLVAATGVALYCSVAAGDMERFRSLSSPELVAELRQTPPSWARGVGLLVLVTTSLLVISVLDRAAALMLRKLKRVPRPPAQSWRSRSTAVLTRIAMAVLVCAPFAAHSAADSLPDLTTSTREQLLAYLAAQNASDAATLIGAFLAFTLALLIIELATLFAGNCLMARSGDSGGRSNAELTRALWRVYAVCIGVIYVGGTAYGSNDESRILAVIGVPFWATAISGLFGFVLGRRIFFRRFWIWSFPTILLWDALYAFVTFRANGVPMSPGFLLLGYTLCIPEYVALWRYPRTPSLWVVPLSEQETPAHTPSPPTS